MSTCETTPDTSGGENARRDGRKAVATSSWDGSLRRPGDGSPWPGGQVTTPPSPGRRSWTRTVVEKERSRGSAGDRAQDGRCEISFPIAATPSTSWMEHGACGSTGPQSPLSSNRLLSLSAPGCLPGPFSTPKPQPPLAPRQGFFHARVPSRLRRDTVRADGMRAGGIVAFGRRVSLRVSLR